MSESRYTQAELNEWADRVDETQPGAHWAPVTVADMLRQAAQDARVIEQFRAWLLTASHCDCGMPCDCVTQSSVLAELDRLAAPQRQDTQG